MESSKTELPPLPEPTTITIGLYGGVGTIPVGKGHSDEAMREYALAAIREAVAAQREKDARICEDLAAVGYRDLRTGAALWLADCIRFGVRDAAAIRGATSPEGK